MTTAIKNRLGGGRNHSGSFLDVERRHCPEYPWERHWADHGSGL